MCLYSAKRQPGSRMNLKTAVASQKRTCFEEFSGPMRNDSGHNVVQRLLFHQRQIMQRIGDHRFAFVAAWMTRDELAAAGDHHFMHVPLHQNFTMSVAGGHRIIVGAIPNQQQRSDPRRRSFRRTHRARRASSASPLGAGSSGITGDTCTRD